MKSTGITRKIDELGRIVIPKEMRRNLGIRDGEYIEILTENGQIILKKHSIIYNYEELSKKLIRIISSIIKDEIIITDRQNIISSTKEEYINKDINEFLISLIDNRETYHKNEISEININDISLKGYIDIVPIISSSDSLGLVIIISTEENNNLKIAKIISKLLSEKIDI